MKYQSKIDSLTIKRTVLTNTMFFLPSDKRNTFKAKIKLINNQIDYYKALSHIDVLGWKESYYLYRSIKFNKSSLIDLCKDLTINNPDILKHELKSRALNYLESKH